jgi:hypothetical protein
MLCPSPPAPHRSSRVSTLPSPLPLLLLCNYGIETSGGLRYTAVDLGLSINNTGRNNKSGRAHDKVCPAAERSRDRRRRTAGSASDPTRVVRWWTWPSAVKSFRPHACSIYLLVYYRGQPAERHACWPSVTNENLSKSRAASSAGLSIYYFRPLF